MKNPEENFSAQPENVLFSLLVFSFDFLAKKMKMEKKKTNINLDLLFSFCFLTLPFDVHSKSKESQPEELYILGGKYMNESPIPKVPQSLCFKEFSMFFL